MKDYKRLTDRDDDGIPYVKCADCYIRDKCDLTKEVCYQELQDRLAELEDKIESGEIDYVAGWKRRAGVAEQKATVWKDCANKWQKYYKEQAEREMRGGEKNG